MNPKPLWQYSGQGLIVSGLLHNLVGLICGGYTWLPFIQNGLIGKLHHFGMENGELMILNAEATMVFWFEMTGLLLIAFGFLARDYIQTTHQPLPSYIGWFLLVVTAFGCMVSPISGFWILLPQAWIILKANRVKS